LKTQAVVNKADGEILCLAFASRKRHDFRLFKESGMHAKPETILKTDTGFQGIAKLHANFVLPKKRSKRHPLSKQDKLHNHDISSQRVLNEYVTGFIKRFRILAGRYRNRRKRFALRFSLICGLLNFDRAV
jgi:hypothetical protein